MDDIRQHDLTEPLPPWAARPVSGGCTYLELGAILPTRDGRRIGNATVVTSWHGDGAKSRVVTDAGNVATLTVGELREFFWPPVYIRSGF